jgi:Na+:H+ antiporter, NhaA family
VRRRPGTTAHRWAIPTRTDIAFAVAVLAVVSTQMPLALRTFLLTLADVDDLFAVNIIAILYTDQMEMLPLALALVCPWCCSASRCSAGCVRGGCCSLSPRPPGR